MEQIYQWQIFSPQDQSKRGMEAEGLPAIRTNTIELYATRVLLKAGITVGACQYSRNGTYLEETSFTLSDLAKI
jgi:hypothetical protein